MFAGRRTRVRGPASRRGTARALVAALLAVAVLPVIESVASAAVPVLFFDMVVDETRGQIYGSDRSAGLVHVLDSSTLGSLGSLDFGAGSEPTGLDMSPDESELAVALFGAGEVAFVDLATLTVTASPAPDVDGGLNQPFDVLHGRAGRLYSVGSPGSSGLDYVHVFDTVTHTEVGRSTEIMRAAPRLAMTSDNNTLYVSDVISSPQKIYRFDISTDTPSQTAAAPHGPVQVNTIAVDAAGTRVFSSRGQVWSADLVSQLGSFTPSGEEIEYSAARDSFFVTSGSQITEYDAGTYDPVVVRLLSGTGGVARVSGDTLFVSTDLGVEALPLDLATTCAGKAPTIIGTDGNDVITGTSKKDVILGLGGNDVIDGLKGRDRICGGDGDDVISGGAGHDSLFGEAGSDELIGNNGEDKLVGGDDDDILKPGGGSDTVTGNAGTDEVVFSGATKRVKVDLIAGTASGQGADKINKVENVVGSKYDDELTGDAGDNELKGGAGADVIDGGSGDDVLRGGNGSDLLFGGPGDDILDGGSGDDIISYEDATGPVDASLTSGVATGEGSDSIAKVENLVGSPFDDTLIGDGGANFIHGLNGADDITGLAGGDLLVGGGGNDLIDGGGGNDDLYGEGKNDVINGGGGEDYIDGGSGKDTLLGGGADDVLVGDDGNDTLSGEAGDDILLGMAGDDIHNGGSGNDWVDFENSLGPVVASLTSNTATGEGADTLIGIEFLFGSAFNDTLIGDSVFNVLVGWDGNDVLWGRSSGDNLWGENGADTVFGEAGDDFLSGGPGSDALNGGTGTDWCEDGESHTSCETIFDLVDSVRDTGVASPYADFLARRSLFTGRYVWPASIARR